MASKIIKTSLFLEELLEVFFHKFMYYVPSKIIYGNVKELLKDQIANDFYDTFYFIDNTLGSGTFNNADAAEVNTYLVGKRTFLEQNTFKLVEKSEEYSALEFQVILEKYYEYLMLFIDITQWLSENVKKYQGEDVHLGIIGGFHLQMQFYITHLKDVCNHFGSLLDLDRDFNFTIGQFVMQYLPDILSRYAKIEDAQIAITTKVVNSDQKEKSDTKHNSIRIPSEQKSKIKKQRPRLDDKEVEALILAKVFNVEEVIVNNKKN